MFDKLIEKLYLKQKNNLAFYDILTKLHNRNYFELKLKNKLECKPAFITVIDVDNLKTINDSEGHLAGDKIIIELANNLSNFFKNGCDICRLSGDEFILISNYNPQLKLDNIKKKIDFSYGIHYKIKYQSINAAIKEADKEMYKMKKTNR